MGAPQLPLRGLAIDWETSGYSIEKKSGCLIPDYAAKHQGLSFGAIIFDVATISPIEELYCEVQFNEAKYTWDEGAEKVHGLSREYLRQHGKTQEEAAGLLANMVLKYCGLTKLLVLGHRVYFDMRFTDQLMMDGLGIELDYDPIKIDSAAFGITFMNETRSDVVFNLLGGGEERGAHNALEDIRMNLASIRQFKDYFQQGVEAAVFAESMMPK